MHVYYIAKNICWLQWELSYFIIIINIFHLKKNKYRNSNFFVVSFPGCPAFSFIMYSLYKWVTLCFIHVFQRGPKHITVSQVPNNIPGIQSLDSHKTISLWWINFHWLWYQLYEELWKQRKLHLAEQNCTCTCSNVPTPQNCTCRFSDGRITRQYRTVNCLLVSY